MLQGSLRKVHVPQVLLEIYTSAQTGVLEVVRGGIRKQVYFRMGMPIFASSNDTSDRMGEILVRQGRLRPDQLRDALTLAQAQGKKLGTVLVELGVLTPEGLVQAVVDQAEAIIHSLFLWEEGDYTFHPGEPQGEDIIPLDMSAANLIMQGVRRMYTPDRLKRLLGSPRRVLGPTHNPAHRFQELQLTDEENRILVLIDGRRSVAEILSAAGEQTTVALRVMGGLLLLQSLEIQGEAESVGVPPPPVSPAEGRALIERAARELPGQDFYQRLRVARSAEPATIGNAYEVRSNEFSAERFQGADYLDLQEALDAIRKLLLEAARTLADPAARGRYDEQLERRSLVSLVEDSYNPDEARQEYERGLSLMQQRRLTEAQQAFESAVKQDSRNAEYLTALGRLYGSGTGEKEADLDRAERCFRKAIEINPKDARNYFYLGHIYQAKDDNALAEKCFLKTLELMPNHPGARKELDALRAGR